MTKNSIFLFTMIFVLSIGVPSVFAQTPELLTVIDTTPTVAFFNSLIPNTENPPSNTQIVSINLDSLTAETMSITVFDNVIEVTHEETITRADDDFTYIGSTSDSYHNVWIAYYEGQMRLELTSPTTNYILEPVGDNSHQITNYSLTGFGAIEDGTTRDINPDYAEIIGNVPVGTFTRSSHNNVEIDVIYLYTDEAEDTKRQNGIRLMGNLGIDKINNAFRQSDIPLELRHVETTNVGRGYVESGTMEVELNRLIDTTDRLMNRGTAVRDKVNADIGFLFIDQVSRPGLCGKVNQILADEATAFLVINVNCGSPIGSVIAHEFGHLAGAHHDTNTNNGYQSTPFTYGHGYTTQQRSTIMAYPCVGCDWQNIYSNPSENFERTNIVSGTESRENVARVITLTGPQMAAFRGETTTDYVSSDTTAPVFSDVPSDSINEANLPTGSKVSFNLPIATDNVDGVVTVTCNLSPGTIFPLGANVVTCTSTDSNSNSDSVSFTITVEDTTGPLISNTPQNITKEATSPLGATATYDTPTAFDLVDEDVTVTCNLSPGTIFSLDDNIVTCTSTDSFDNSSSVSFTITVEDTTAPVITVPSNQSFEATAVNTPLNSTNYSVATATDIYDVNITSNATAKFSLGDTVIKWTATDESGNIALGYQTITIQDTTDPVITASTIPSNITAEAISSSDAVVTYDIPDATDLVDDVVDVTCSPNSGSTFALNNTTVICTAIDDAGNTSSESFTVTVQDKTSPVITVPSNQSFEATDVNTPLSQSDYGAATATDIYDVNITSNATAKFSLGDTVIQWTATDESGNISTGYQTITLQTTIPFAIDSASLDFNTNHLTFVFNQVVDVSEIQLNDPTNRYDPYLSIRPVTYLGFFNVFPASPQNTEDSNIIVYTMHPHWINKAEQEDRPFVVTVRSDVFHSTLGESFSWIRLPLDITEATITK